MTVMLLISLSLLSTFSFAPEPYDLLQTHSMFSGLNLPFGRYTVLTGGMPVLTEGANRIPGWDSFASLEVTNPLEAGLWCNGMWCLNFIPAQVPDSSFSSKVGLLENTAERNRYSAYLRRPLFSELRFDLSLSRDRTDKDQVLRVYLGEFRFGGRSWQNDGSAYALWTTWHRSTSDVRLSFSRLYSGGRKFELTGSLHSDNIVGMNADAGFLASYTEDSVACGEVRLLLRKSVGNTSLMCRGVLGQTDDTLSTGGTAGFITEIGEVTLELGHIYKSGNDTPYSLCVLQYGPAELSLILDNYGNFRANCSVITKLPYAVLKTSVSTSADTAGFTGLALPYIKWGETGHIYGGASWDYRSIDREEDILGFDIVSLFTLNTFAFIFSIEEVLDDSRNYTFGITWGFDDRYEYSESTLE